MPQPLSKVRSDAEVELTPEALIVQPELATWVTLVIAKWAHLENALRLLLVYMLEANAQAAFAMFTAMKSDSAQADALFAAAKVTLGDDYQVFEALMAAVRSVQPDRNRLVHWTWARSKQVPDALLLVDPEVYRERLIRARYTMDEFRTAPMTGPRSMSVDEIKELHDFDRSTILVYRKADLEQASARLSQTWWGFAFFLDYLEFKRHPPTPWEPVGPWRDALHRNLSKLPPIQDALNRLRRKSNPSPHGE